MPKTKVLGIVNVKVKQKIGKMEGGFNEGAKKKKKNHMMGERVSHPLLGANHFISSHVSLGCSVLFVSSDLLITDLFSDATLASFTPLTGTRRNPVPLRHGLECLAFPTPDTGFSAKVLRRCHERAHAEQAPRQQHELPARIRRDNGRRHRILMYLDILELQAAPCNRPRRKGFLGSGCWRNMTRLTVVMASGKCVEN